MRVSIRPVWIYFTALLFLVLIAACLWKSGDLLVNIDPPQHVRWAVVLAGESRDMERSETALALFRDGRFDSLILSGPRCFRNHHESEFSSEFLTGNGFPKDRIFQLPNEAVSTATEAIIVIQQARLLGIDTLLVITSNYHSARAHKIFKKLAGETPVIRLAVAESGFDPKAWWSYREARVIWVVEWLKTLMTSWEIRHDNYSVEQSGSILLEPNPRAVKTLPAAVAPPVDSIPTAVRDSLKKRPT